MRESSASVCQANVCFYPADIPIRSPNETPHPRPAARVIRYGLRFQLHPQRNLPPSYSGTASVGDFLTITLDPAAHTLTYKNLSNLDSGIIPYSVNSDGTYALDDPTRNLIAAYEVPNYALLLQATTPGPNHDALAMVTAVDKRH